MTSSPPSKIVLNDAATLQTLLTNGEVTSLQLVGLFLNQIDRHNRSGKAVNAVISTAPREYLLAQAEALDTERREGKLRGALHGIPILIKDAIVTGPELGMPTTVGSWAISMLKSRKNATLIDQLIAAGGIILAKTNLTEFCGLKSNDTAVGWSAYAGQTNSPYRRDDLKDEDQPVAGGSSSGSAVGIATGFAPLSIGTETSGSTVYPASTNGLYAMKLGHNQASTEGVFRLSRAFDGIGVLARTPQDLAVLTETVLTPEALARFPYRLLHLVQDQSDFKVSVGIFPLCWGMPRGNFPEKWWELPAVVSRYESIFERLEGAGHRVWYPIDIEEADTLGTDLIKIAYYEFPSLVKEFLRNFENDSTITSLEDIIAWNERNAEKAMPPPSTGQTELIASLKSDLNPETRDESVAAVQRLADEDGMGKFMDEWNLDVLVAVSGSTLITFAACAGWPVATCPLGNLEKNGQPYGVFVTARSEDTLCRFMGSWSRTMPGVQGPDVSTE